MRSVRKIQPIHDMSGKVGVDVVITVEKQSFWGWLWGESELVRYLGSGRKWQTYPEFDRVGGRLEVWLSDQWARAKREGTIQ